MTIAPEAGSSIAPVDLGRLLTPAGKEPTPGRPSDPPQGPTRALLGGGTLAGALAGLVLGLRDRATGGAG
ncbi:MAG TPA: hypothetical protein VMZ51_04175 [Acidimicrobiales bacterium]|nr:hypothetical protein [Acidimicrobiales bacterium]